MSLSERVDNQFRNVGVALQDINGMMRHILDCMGALKFRLEEGITDGRADSAIVTHALVSVFGNSVKTIVDHMTEFEVFDRESAINHLISVFPDDSKKKDGRSWLPLHWAAVLENVDAEDLRVIIRDRPIAAQKGHLHLEDVTSPIAQQENSPVLYKGLLPLHFIVSLRHPAMENVNIIYDANPAAVTLHDQRGWLPMHWCAYNCRETVVMKKLIKTHDEACFMANKKGKLPFQLSAYNVQTEMLDMLLKINPEAIAAMDYNGNTPLHDAAKTYNYEAIQKLLLIKLDLGRVRNFKEQLPIHKAFSNIPAGSSRIHFRHLESIKALISRHPETVSLPDGDDNLPLHLAVYYNSSFEVIEALYNVFPSAALIQDSQGKLPISYANTADVKRLLMKASPPLIKAGLTDSFSRFAN
mmetsp:Transcript_33544/g.48666  ORF Transcript_33544/g.48666 Transcript_33544/m.48666 type:complete len:413 (+) Transcript_33544:12-1250(+)